MNQIIPLAVGVLAMVVGAFLGYYARQSIAKRNYRTIEARLQKKVEQSRQESEQILSQAKERALQVIESAQKEENQRREGLIKTERLLLRRESLLDEKMASYENKENDFNQKVEKLREIKENIENLKKEALDNLEKISGLSREEAKKQFLDDVEREFQKDLMEKTRQLEDEGWQKYEQRAKEILALAIQKCAINQSQEITTSTVSLPSEEIKGRIIGKEGRNIRTLERMAGVEIIVDETPEAVVISAFDPIRRQIAKIALEN
jgi:ribonucrease Y